VALADALLIGAVVSWGGYLTVSKPLIMKHGSLPVLAATFLLGCLLDVPIALLASPRLPALGQISPAAWLALGVLTLFIAPVNLACQNLALRRLDASQVANFSNVAPVLTVLWGAWLFGEAITPSLVLGGGLALTGVVWTSRRSRPPAEAEAEAGAIAPAGRPAPGSDWAESSPVACPGRPGLAAVGTCRIP